MYLRSLSISNYYCFGEMVKIEFASTAFTHQNLQHWTLLTGDNGSGKSLILKTVARLLMEAEGETKMTLLDKLRMKQGPYHEILKKQRTRRANGREQGSIMLELDGMILSADVNKDAIMGELMIARKDQADAWPEWYGYGVNRFCRPAKTMSIHKQAEKFCAKTSHYHTLLQSPADIPAIAAWKSVLPKGYYNELIQKYKGIMDSITGCRPEYHIMHHKGVLEVPTEELSTGHETLLGWMMDLAGRMILKSGLRPGDNIEKALHKKVVVLVDEFGNHLFPSRCGALMKALEDVFRGAQFILTTHNPLAVTHSDRATVYEVEHEKTDFRGQMKVRRIHGNQKQQYGLRHFLDGHSLDKLEDALLDEMALKIEDLLAEKLKNPVVGSSDPSNVYFRKMNPKIISDQIPMQDEGGGYAKQPGAYREVARFEGLVVVLDMTDSTELIVTDEVMNKMEDFQNQFFAPVDDILNGTSVMKDWMHRKQKVKPFKLEPIRQYCVAQEHTGDGCNLVFDLSKIRDDGIQDFIHAVILRFLWLQESWQHFPPEQVPGGPPLPKGIRVGISRGIIIKFQSVRSGEDKFVSPAIAHATRLQAYCKSLGFLVGAACMLNPVLPDFSLKSIRNVQGFKDPAQLRVWLSKPRLDRLDMQYQNQFE